MIVYQLEDLPELLSVIDYIRFLTSEMTRHHVYFGHGTDNAWDDALALVMHIIDCDHSLGQKVMHAKLTKKEKESLLALLEKRINERLPVPYLTNQAMFCGLPFYVNETVLIPRSPIAEMIQQRFEPWFSSDSEYPQMLELCTGSGCIAIAMAYAFPNASITATDISEDVLQVAAHNVAAHDLEDRLALIQSDVFEQVMPAQFELIVSNPPYASRDEIPSLPEEYGNEPELALFADDDGLAIVDKLLHQAKDYLAEQGLLVVEVGNSAQTLQEKYPNVPFMWIEFEAGGEGVFVLTKQQLDEYF